MRQLRKGKDDLSLVTIQLSGAFAFANFDSDFQNAILSHQCAVEQSGKRLLLLRDTVFSTLQRTSHGLTDFLSYLRALWGRSGRRFLISVRASKERPLQASAESLRCALSAKPFQSVRRSVKKCEVRITAKKSCAVRDRSVGGGRGHARLYRHLLSPMTIGFGRPVRSLCSLLGKNKRTWRSCNSKWTPV